MEWFWILVQVLAGYATKEQFMQTSSGVAMISSVFYPSLGGAQRVVLDTGRELRSRGIDTFVVTRHYRGLANYEEVQGVPTFRVGKGDAHKIIAALSFILGAVWLLWRLRRRYHVLHCHQMISPMTIGLLAKLLTRRPLIIMPHRSGEIGDIGILTLRRPVTGRMRLSAARHWGDGFVCISPAIHAELRGIGVAEERLWDIANGVDIDRICPVPPERKRELQAHLGLPDAQIITFTGRLVTEKGVDVLIAALPTLQQQVSNAHLVLVGEGDQRKALETQATKLGVHAVVTFVGLQDDVTPWLQASDVFVLPSYAEGLPVALLEAQACGLPCVGSDIDGTRQVVQNGVSGRLVPTGDPVALAQALAQACVAPEARNWASAGRGQVVRLYALSNVINQYLAMYRAVAPQFAAGSSSPVRVVSGEQ